MSIVYGWVGEMALLAWALSYLGLAAAGIMTIFFGTFHFYLMELDPREFKFILQIRPLAYIGFPLSAFALANLLVSLIS